MRLNAVSIHPLLKLIQIDEAGVINLPCFNTSHVKVNQYRYYSALVFEYRFNTSHVKVNHRSECSAWVQGRVSIHPMLKLIRLDFFRRCSSDRFNTSHVKVNRSRKYFIITRNVVSIHPMLKLITILPLSQSKVFGFNTSHVKVNLKVFCINIFFMPVSIHPMLKLILFAFVISNSFVPVSIHPMLKLIQRISCIPYNTLYQIPQYLSTFLKFLPATAPFAKKIYKITAMPLFLRIHAILH